MKKTFFIALALIGVGFLAKPNEVSASTITIQKGDTLWEYSQKYKISVDTIAEFNNINLNKYMMWPGDKINIPDGEDNESGAQFTNHFVETATPMISTYTKPVATHNVQQVTPTKVAPAPAPETTTNTPTTTPTTKPATSSLPASEASAKAAIAYRESRGSYTARNGKYVGKYQIDASYLNGDYSEANQEATAQKYVEDRYTTWSNALAHSNATGWY